MAAFEKKQIGKRLARALRTHDGAETRQVRHELIEIYGDNGIELVDMEAAVALARDARDWESVVEISEAIIAHDQSGSARLVRLSAQALIELGALSAAECVLNQLLEGEPGDQEAEVNGLLGRVAKQRYVNFNRKQQLRSAIEAYHRASKDPKKTAWAYSNMLGLLRRAEEDNVTLGQGTPRLNDIRDELVALVRGKNPQARDVWERAMNIEVLLLENEREQAAKEARTLAEADSATPFELNSFSRQLAEVWRLPGDDPLRIALNNSSLSMGAGAAASVPPAATLEKILGDERPVPADVYELGIRAARQVCMITDRYDNPLGTGFTLPGSALSTYLDDSPVLVTNAHVIADQDWANKSRAKFSRFLGEDAQPLIVGDLELIWTSPVGELDASVLTFDESALAGLDGIPVSEIAPDPSDTDPYVYVIGHPEGRALEMSIRGNGLLAASDTKLHYEAPTERGSSGSPVFDKAWNLVGLHHTGSFSIESLTDPTDRYPANEATFIGAISDAITAKLERDQAPGSE